MTDQSHVSDLVLLQYLDGENSPNSNVSVEEHLQTCVDCSNRLRSLEDASEAYGQYREQVLKPSLQLPSKWPALGNRLQQVQPTRRNPLFSPAFFWASAVVACTLIAAVLYLFRAPVVPNAQELLQEASSNPNRMHSHLLLTAGHSRIVRPAVLNSSAQAAHMPVDQQATLNHVQALFVRADYDWADPLSPRSFAAWRNGLKRREDRVTVVWGENRVKRFYRLRTGTSLRNLHAASLTFRVVDYRVVEGAFEFEAEPTITLAETEEAPAIAKAPLRQTAPIRHLSETESAATPEDELRVFAALNEIGADVDDPIDVRLDKGGRQVVITGMGLSPERRTEIVRAVASLPRTAVELTSSPSNLSADRDRSGKQENLQVQANSAFRRELEARAGGALPLQTITDRALDASNSLLARAHALQILAREFPPTVESSLTVADRNSLGNMRQRHAKAVEQLALQLGEALGSLLVSPVDNPSVPAETQRGSETSWQSGVESLYQTTRDLDKAVGRLFAGASPQEPIEPSLVRLRQDLDKVEQLARTQVRSGR